LKEVCDASLLIRCDTCGDLKKKHCAKKKCKAEREAATAARSVDNDSDADAPEPDGKAE